MGSDLVDARKRRFECRLDPENYDFLFRLAEAEGRKMSNMVNEILSRMREKARPQATGAGR